MLRDTSAFVFGKRCASKRLDGGWMGGWGRAEGLWLFAHTGMDLAFSGSGVVDQDI